MARRLWTQPCLGRVGGKRIGFLVLFLFCFLVVVVFWSPNQVMIIPLPSRRQDDCYEYLVLKFQLNHLALHILFCEMGGILMSGFVSVISQSCVLTDVQYCSVLHSDIVWCRDVLFIGPSRETDWVLFVGCLTPPHWLCG